MQTSTPRKVTVVAVTPPPVTGMTLVTRHVTGALRAAGILRDLTFSKVGEVSGARWTLRKHATLFARLIIGARGRGAVYFVPDSGGGLLFNLILCAPVLRLGYGHVTLHHHVFSYVRTRDARFAWMLKILGPRVRHIVLGPAMADGLRAHYGDHLDCHVMGNAGFVADTPIPRTRDGLRTVGFLSNVTRDKGIDDFMAVMRAAQAANPDLACVIGGPIRDAELTTEVDAFIAELPERRRLAGFVTGDTKAGFFDGIDLLLFPSRYANEALPVTIYEALATGIPVLATDKGCVPDQLTGTDWTTSPDTFAAMATARIAGWIAAPATYIAAQTTALHLFETQAAADAAALENLITMLGQGT